MVSISATAVVAASAISAYAASSSADKQAGAIKGAANTANARVAPYANAGLPAVNSLADIGGLNGPEGSAAARDRFVTSPGYGFTYDEGLRAIDHGAASRGILRSGDTIKEEQKYGAGLASQEFRNYVGDLKGLATLGANAATGQGTNDTTGAVNLASIYGNEAKGLSNTASGLASDKNVQAGLKDLYSTYGSGSGSGSGSAYPGGLTNSSGYTAPAYGGVDPSMTAIY